MYCLFTVRASSFNPLLGRTIGLGAGVKQTFDCLLIQNRQAVQSSGRSMDWTLEDNVVDGLFFCTTLIRPYPICVSRSGDTRHQFGDG